jgi:hypothetical protein
MHVLDSLKLWNVLILFLGSDYSNERYLTEINTYYAKLPYYLYLPFESRCI